MNILMFCLSLISLLSLTIITQLSEVLSVNSLYKLIDSNDNKIYFLKYKNILTTNSTSEKHFHNDFASFFLYSESPINITFSSGKLSNLYSGRFYFIKGTVYYKLETNKNTNITKYYVSRNLEEPTYICPCGLRKYKDYVIYEMSCSYY